MTALFTRDGTAAPTPVVLNAKGKPECTVVGPCRRCAGHGGWKGWPGFTCYDCGGRNSMTAQRTTHRLYTAEELAKLNATAAKKAAAKTAKAEAEAVARKAQVEAQYGALLDAARPYAERNHFIADVVAKAEDRGFLSEAQIIALNNAVNAEMAKDGRPAPKAGEFVGTEGERRSFAVTVDKVLTFETAFGTMFLHLMKDANGNTVVYKGSVLLASKDETVQMVATVKEHTEYKGVNQTVVARPKLAK